MLKLSEKEIDTTEMVKELQRIRNLLILQLIKNGVTSKEISLATGMGSSTIRKMFPNVKRADKGTEQ